MEILVTGVIHNKWFGKCENCYTISLATDKDFRSELELQKVVDWKCPYCSKLMKFYRDDTDIGKKIKDDVPGYK
jgi:RNase P subunit RPR2